MREVAGDGADGEIPPGERRRGPVRSIVWVTLEAGTAKPMGLRSGDRRRRPAVAADVGDVDRGRTSRDAAWSGSDAVPDADLLWRAVDQFHLGVMPCLRDYSGARCRPRDATPRPPQRTDDGADVRILRPPRRDRRAALRPRQGSEADPSDPLLAACRMVAEAIHAPFTASAPEPPRRSWILPTSSRSPEPHGCAFARRCCAANGGRQDVGPLVAWHGEERNPVALIRGARRRYTMIEPSTGTQPAGRPLAGDGTGPGGRDVLSGAAVAPASVSGSAGILDPAFHAAMSAASRSPWSRSACCRWSRR